MHVIENFKLELKQLCLPPGKRFLPLERLLKLISSEGLEESMLMFQGRVTDHGKREGC